MGLRLRKGDLVIAIAGKDKGKSGRILKCFPAQARVIVEGLNYVKKHLKRTREDQQGGIIEKESPIHISNLMLLCKRCNRPTKSGITILTDGTKIRFCKRCKETV